MRHPRQQWGGVDADRSERGDGRVEMTDRQTARQQGDERIRATMAAIYEDLALVSGSAV
jgi:hypothetical protein